MSEEKKINLEELDNVSGGAEAFRMVADEEERRPRIPKPTPPKPVPNPFAERPMPDEFDSALSLEDVPRIIIDEE